MVPLIAIEAIAIGFLIAFVGRLLQARRFGDPEIVAARARFRAAPQLAVATIVVVVALVELHPFDKTAPMVLEAQWDRVNFEPRRQVTRCLQSRRRDEPVMASMGSLGHYMQEASRAGFFVRDFLHEGNGDIWLAALDEPLPYVRWIMMEEKAEGGDMLYKRAREHPDFLRGYSRVCEGAGLALYERQNRILKVNR
jgi:hypothetical protein